MPLIVSQTQNDDRMDEHHDATMDTTMMDTTMETKTLQEYAYNIHHGEWGWKDTVVGVSTTSSNAAKSKRLV
jgi:hypothetical protein